MTTHRKLLTIVTESSLETAVTTDIDQLGARGWTITDARGKGARGVRDAGWDTGSNIRLEVLCDEATATRISQHLRDRYYANYAMVLWITDVDVLRPDKF